MSVEDLLAHVHPDIVYRRVELPTEENALIPWREALACLEPVPQEIEEAFMNPQGGPGWTYSPEDAAIPAARRYLDRQTRAIELLHAGIDLGSLQLPLDEQVDRALGFDERNALYGLEDMVAIVSAADGKLDEAATALGRLLRFGRMFCNGEADLSTYIFGLTMRTSTVHRIRNLAADARMTKATLELLDHQITEDEAAPDGYALSMKADFCGLYLKWFDDLDDSLPSSTVVDAFLEKYPDRPVDVLNSERNESNESDEPLSDGSPTEEPFVDDGRLAWRREKLHRLLDGHPRLYSKIETVRKTSNQLAAALAGWDCPWDSQPTSSEREPQQDEWPWPFHLQPEMMYEGLGPSEDARRYRQEHSDLCDWCESIFPPPPSDEEIDQAAAGLRLIDNPIGRQIGPSFGLVHSTRMILVAHRARCRLARTLVALRRYSIRHGGLPDALDDLVAAGVLDALPIDPFSGHPIRYSRERQVIWSVSSDGDDDGGDANDIGKPLAMSRDIVWQIPAEC